MDDIDDDDKDISKLTGAEMEARLIECMKQMPLEDQQAFRQLIEWTAYEKPKHVELTKELMESMIVDIKRKNARRRLGARYGTILPFRKPEKKR